jgi:hypothetical protein
MTSIIKLFLISNFIFLEIKKIKSFLVNNFKKFNEIKLKSYINSKNGTGNIYFKDENINIFLKKNLSKYKKNKKKNKKKILVELLLSHHSEPMVLNCLIGKDLEKFYNAECVGLIKKNDLYTKKIAESFGIQKFEFIHNENFLSNLKYFFIALNSIRYDKIEKQLINYKRNGYELGKSALENYYRFYNAQTQKKNKFLLYLFLSRAIKSNDWARKIFKQKFKMLVLGENQFIPNKIIFHCALKSNIPVYTFGGSASSNFIGTLYKKYKDRYSLKYKFSPKLTRLLLKIYKNKNIIDKIKKDNGIKHIGKETVWSEQKSKYTYSFKNKNHFNQFCNFDENNKKNILFLPHAMSDNIFNNEWNIFKTNYDWFYETILQIKKLDYVNWIIKPHPFEYKFPGIKVKDIFNKIIKKEKHIYFLNENLHVNNIYKHIDVALTGNGSAGFEFPSLGIPTITTSDSGYSNFNFTHSPRNKVKYFGLLNKLDKLKKLNKTKIKNAQIFWHTYENSIRNSHNFLPIINQHGQFKKEKFFSLLSKKKFKKNSNNFSNDIFFQLKNNNRISINSDLIKKYRKFNFKLNDA